MSGNHTPILRGCVQVAIDSPLPERFLNLCAYHGISMWELVREKDGYRFFLYARDLARLQPICGKTNTKLRVTGRYGAPFFLKKYRGRKMFAVSFVLCAAFVYVLTLFIWRIQVTGLTVHDEQEVLDCLADLSVQYGMRSACVDCEEIEAALRDKFDDFIWVAASVEGTQLRIQIKEDTESYEIAETDTDTPADLVADVDGVIVRMVTQRGTPQVQVGDTVTSGQVLIAGSEAYLDDAGSVLRYETMQAQGEVYVQTTVSYDDCFTYEHEVQVKTGRKKYGFTVWIFGKKFTLLSGRHSYEQAQVSGEKRTLVLGGSFYLPVAYCITTAAETETVRETYTKEEAQALANTHFSAFRRDLEKKGVEITENRVKITLEEDECRTSGTLVVISPTGTLAESAPLPDTPSSDNTEEEE